MRSRLVAALAFGLLAAPLAIATAAQAQSAPLSVELDHTARINLRGSAASVVVGNPQIADVTVVDSNTLFVSGRGFGATEIVVLDALGRTIYQNNVIVSAPTTGQVRVWRGSAVTDMSCASTCAPSVRASESTAP